MENRLYLIIIMYKYTRSLNSICEGHYTNQTMAFCTIVDSVMKTPLQKTRISLLQEILLFQLFISKTGIKSQDTIIFLEIIPCKMFIN